MGLPISVCLFAFCFLLLPRMSSSAFMEPTERASLLSFMAGITADPGKVLADWNSTLPVCNWTGVRCGRESTRVAELDLSGKLLRGTISPALSNLSFLLILDLSRNELSGSIPAEFSALARLQQLSLAYNHLVGAIPSQLGQLASLQYLDLSYNHFAGQIPVPLFCNTSNLEYIDLSNNSLVGQIPSASSCDIAKLRFLLLWSNRLTGSLPSLLSNASSLKWIDVESNYLTGDLPSEAVRGMVHLQILYLSYNNFQKSDLKQFALSLANCTSLHELELAGNGLEGQIHDIVGYLPTSLTQIHLEENHLRGFIPPNIADFANLTMLNLSSNILAGTIPSQLSLMTKLERICLSNNSLSGPIPSGLVEIQHMGLLDLSRNHLSGSIPESLCRLSQLRKLLLHDNQLTGTIPPSLGNCTNLEILDLSRNRIGGRIPREIAALESLKLYLNLSGNFLEGTLPLELSNMNMVLSIDLSCNNLSGVIPPQLGSCIAMEYLNLSHNSFTGPLPLVLGELPYLQVLDISSNRLSGEIPESLENSKTLNQLNLSFNGLKGRVPSGGIFETLPLSSLMGNPLLCGRIHGMRPCKGKRSLSTGFILLPIVLAPFIISTVGIFLFSRSATPLRRKFSCKRNMSVRDDEDDPMQLTGHQYPKISYRELVEATNNFDRSNMVGSGRFGRVYKGTSRDGTPIAVKVLDCKAVETVKSFKRECEILRRTRHRNLIRTITACSRPDFKALVLPLMKNGSLENYLHSSSIGMDLIQVLSICNDIAEGMAYLHHHAPAPIVHCDLKPSNVLLNDDMTAHVADFGVSRLIVDGGEAITMAPDSLSGSVTGLLVGSIGYIAPEYGMGKQASREGDVYSFGVLLLEMITRRRPTDVMFQEGLTLQDWVREHYSAEMEPFAKDFFAVAPPTKDSGDGTAEAWWHTTMELVELGLMCTETSPSKRPTMIHVADELGRLKEFLQHKIISSRN
ncbi:putative leucine-rich repeat receptor-like serine/threonine-protein kinase [Nymphaea thermarum]|nr:putative leucine-rich repeat receptor-like serine/threonine-protein kinase [Nymphaea thermarum]